MSSMKDGFFKAAGSLGSLQGKWLGLSEEFRKFYASGYRCSQCDERLVNTFGGFNLNFYSADGERVPSWLLPVVLLKGEWAECPKCRYRFKVKGRQELPAADVEVNVEETERQEESFGSDSRLIDNSKSSASVRRRFAVSKEWSKTYALEYEKAVVTGGGLDVGLAQSVNLKLSCDETIRKHFSISEDTKEIYSEEVEIDVPGATRLRIIFQWKRILQCGFVTVRKPDGELSKVPFRVGVGVTFDQMQVAEAVSGHEHK